MNKKIIGIFAILLLSILLLYFTIAIKLPKREESKSSQLMSYEGYSLIPLEETYCGDCTEAVQKINDEMITPHNVLVIERYAAKKHKDVLIRTIGELTAKQKSQTDSESFNADGSASLASQELKASLQTRTKELTGLEASLIEQESKIIAIEAALTDARTSLRDCEKKTASCSK